MDDPFDIATLSAGGSGRLGFCRLPGLAGMVDADIAALRAWQPDFVVSMTTDQEMGAVGIADLGEMLKRFDIAWHHLPVADYGGLDGDLLALWPDLSARLNSCLDGDGAVLFHCRGGRGRSGMMVLRMLVERGEHPKDSLMLLRQVRAGAVETDAQFQWAADGRFMLWNDGAG